MKDNCRPSPENMWKKACILDGNRGPNVDKCPFSVDKLAFSVDNLKNEWRGEGQENVLPGSHMWITCPKLWIN
jgi:hypothetical protein